MLNKNFKAPIFIVGVPRSGTTLLAAMLAAHSRLSCGTETRFFHHLSRVNPADLYDSETWPHTAVDFIFSLNLVDIPVPEHYKISHQQLEDYLSSQQPGIPSILAALTEQFMLREGKQRWIEKSPEHTLYVNDIRRYFPDSPIIRIVRDPRDAAISQVKAPWGPPDFLEALIQYRKYERASAAFFNTDPDSYTVYYENLLESPEIEIKKICSFIGESYEAQMLNTSESADNLVTARDSWHRIVHKPIDASRIGVWKRELSLENKRLAEAFIGDLLHSHGYECSEQLSTCTDVYPSIESFLNHRNAINSLSEYDYRFWAVNPAEEKTAAIYLGFPDTDNWLGHKKPERWWNMIHLIIGIFSHKLKGHSIHWFRDWKPQGKIGYVENIFAIIFKLTENQSRSFTNKQLE
jgi:hypothetical protein